MPLTTLYRPVNQHELLLIEANAWQAFPPRLSDQPIFYPVMNEQYAIDITREWNVPSYGKGYVVAWEMDEDYLKKFAVQTVGLDHYKELWVPSEELEEFNAHILGLIRVTQSFE